MASHLNHRRNLDYLLLTDSVVSLTFGLIALISPHNLLQKIGGGQYNHDTHEVFRLYGCLRIATGWIIYHVRALDDGRFRRNVCEAQSICYFLQAVSVLRAQCTDRRNNINWIVLFFLSVIGFGYAQFRFSFGGNMIKVYELPQNCKSIR